MNFTGKQNLLKFKNSCVVTIKGNNSIKKGIFIPIEDNHIFITSDDSQKAKGAYIDFIAWESQGSQYGDTHSLRQSLSKELRSKMTDEQLKEVPYIGNMKPYELQNSADQVNAPQLGVDPNDDLPF